MGEGGQVEQWQDLSYDMLLTSFLIKGQTKMMLIKTYFYMDYYYSIQTTL